MLVSTTDPITGNDVRNTEDAPYVVEGTGNSALKIYFESEQSKQEYLEISVSGPESNSIDAYNEISDNETMGTIN
jgi:hypothetical protein